MRVEHIGEATLYLADCRDVLALVPECDLVCTDPPYGIGFAAQPTKWQRRAGKQAESWDDHPPDDLAEVIAKGREAIVWGGNYFRLPPSRGWLSWFKPDAPPSMGHFELAWTSLDRTAQQISCSISATNKERVGHPTQKPLAVMRWSLSFVPQAKTILDPYMGSGTTGVAAIQLGRKFIGIEREPHYFELACRRIAEAEKQPDFFNAPAPGHAQSRLDL